MQLDKRPLETIWRVSDELWNKLKPVLDEYDPPKLTGRKRINSRAALDAIIFRLRSGCQESTSLGSFQMIVPFIAPEERWERNGVLDRIWVTLIEECEELGGVDWQWQSADTAMALVTIWWR